MIERLERQQSLTANQWKIFAASILSIMLDFFDFLLIGFTLAFFVPRLEPDLRAIGADPVFVGDRRRSGAIFFGWLGDKIGRRKSLPACTPVATNCLSMAASAASPTLKGSASAGIRAGCRIAAYADLDPKKDLTLVNVFGAEALDLFAEGKLDAYLAFSPEVQELHARKAGHVILRTAEDRPWSQYFCCMLAANREYATRYPVATKRVIRAVLKAADRCASKPELAARMIVEGGFTKRYEYALQTLTENPYGAWREYDAEDTMRFYALRLHELGMIKSSPQKIIAEGTDWRFLNEVKRELKA